jgi:hypothetical protein
MPADELADAIGFGRHDEIILHGLAEFISFRTGPAMLAWLDFDLYYVGKARTSTCALLELKR